MNIGIYGYGNLGKGVEDAIKRNSDMTLKAVFTRRSPESLKIAGEMGAKAVVGIDAHTPDAYFWEELRNEAFEKLRAFGVELTEEIRFFDKS